MNTSKQVSTVSSIILIVFLMGACGNITQEQAGNVTPGTVPTLTHIVEAPIIEPTGTPFPNVTSIALPTLGNAPPVTLQPTETPLPASLPKFSLDGYVMLFSRDGDLYFQDGDNLPVKLIHVGDTHYDFYKISDDNQKVTLGLTYLMNTDGTQQKVILSSGWWNQMLWGTRLGSAYFVPGTHQLLFSTYLCNSFEKPTTCVSSIYLVDTDTGENKKLADLGFSGANRSEIFKISPNGKMVAIATASFVDIIDMEGKVIRHDVLHFKPSTPDIIFPTVSWLPDSSGLIVALPNTLFDSTAYNYVPAYTIWRYKIDSDAAIQIPLNPSPMAFGYSWGEIQVSPDGKWIVYGGLGYNPEVYLGNLANGQTQIFGKATQANFSWGPDSKHFIATSAGSVLGAIDTPILMDANNCFGWVDGNHLTCPITQEDINKIGIAEIVSEGLKLYDLGFDQNVKLLLIKPK